MIDWKIYSFFDLYTNKSELWNTYMSYMHVMWLGYEKFCEWANTHTHICHWHIVPLIISFFFGDNCFSISVFFICWEIFNFWKKMTKFNNNARQETKKLGSLSIIKYQRYSLRIWNRKWKTKNQWYMCVGLILVDLEIKIRMTHTHTKLIIIITTN